MEEILYWRNNYRKLTESLRSLEESTEMKVVLVWCQVGEGNYLYTGIDSKNLPLCIRISFYQKINAKKNLRKGCGSI